jgi:hypothetical protein
METGASTTGGRMTEEKKKVERKRRKDSPRENGEPNLQLR